MEAIIKILEEEFGWNKKNENGFSETQKMIIADTIKAIQVEAKVKPACFDWQKERPTKPCVVMTRVWNKRLGIYDYNIWRFEKIDCDGGWYLGWLTEDGEEWDDIKDCNFDEYCIIESKSV